MNKLEKFSVFTRPFRVPFSHLPFQKRLVHTPHHRSNHKMKGKQQTAKSSQIIPASMKFDARSLEFERLWLQNKQRWHLYWICLWFLRYEFLSLFAFQVPLVICRLLECHFTYLIFHCLEKKDYDIGRKIGYFLCSSVCETCMKTLQDLKSNEISTKFSNVLIALLHRNYIDSCGLAFEEDVSARIITLISVHLPFVLSWSLCIVNVVAVPVQVVVFTQMLWKVVGWEVIVCYYLVLALVLVLQIFVLTASVRSNNQAVHKATELNRIWCNILEGIHIIKYNCWEQPFVVKIRQVVGDYFGILRRHTLFLAVFTGIFLSCTGILTPVAILMGKTKFHPIMRYFIISTTMALLLTFFHQLGQSLLYTQRFLAVLKEYSSLMEIIWANSKREVAQSQPMNSENAVEFEGASVRISKEFSLFIADFCIKKGEFVAVSGAFGGGKSAFLLAINKYFPSVSGRISQLKSAYCPQHMWLNSGTVRENILMGRAFDEEKYWAVVEACALVQDFDHWSERDENQVGERGTALSGGQKARICLARALYSSEADVFLLDDIFSALDFQTQSCIISKMPKLYSDKTFIISVSNRHLKRHFSKFILVDSGRVSLAKDINEAEQAEEPEENAEIHLHPNNERVPLLLEDGYSSSEEAEEISSSSTPQVQSFGQKRLQKGHPKSSSIVLNFLKTGKLYSVLVVIAFLLGCLGYLMVLKMYDWSTECKKNGDWVLFGVIWASQTVLAISKCLCLFVFVRSTTRILYNSCIERILETSPLYFFKTPISHISAILEKDSAAIINWFGLVMVEIVEYFSFSCAVIFMNCKFVRSMIWFSPFLVAALIFVHRRRIHNFSPLKYEQIKQLDSLIEQVNSTKNGVSIIHSLGIQIKLREKFIHALQLLETASCKERANNLKHFSASTFLCYVYMLVSIYLGTKYSLKGKLEMSVNLEDLKESYGRFLVLILSFAKANESAVSGVLRFKVHLVSLKRIFSLNALQAEKDLGQAAVPLNWPQRGNITFDCVSSSLDENPPKQLVDRVSLKIESGEKVAVCGRTGAGKSSLFNLILRILPINSGSIFIDGIDISTVPIAVLRQRIAFVPQEPYIFNVSVRDNIDPLRMHSEQKLWSVLSKVGMQKIVMNYELKLDQQNLKLSQGEMQLISLARVLLKEPKILFLDEFTSKLDSEAARKVADICYTQLDGCTVVSIVHNLASVVKLDKVVVLEAGRIVENGSPNELLNQPDSFLSSFIHHLKHE